MSARECISCGNIHDPQLNVHVGQYGELDQPLCSDCRAAEVSDQTMLDEREAKMYTLKQQGYSHEEIADIMAISKGAVDSLGNRVRQKFEAAQNTVAMLGDQ